MIIKFDYFDIIEVETTRKTREFTVSKPEGDEYYLMGRIEFSPRWRQYVFLPVLTDEYIWSKDCLRDIANFLEKITKEWRKNVQKVQAKQ